MSADCPTLEIYPQNIDLFADSGHVYLDVDESTSVSLSKELTSKDGLSISALEREFSITLPASAKNFYYLKSIFDPSAEKTEYIKCRITLGSETLYHSRLYGGQKSNTELQVILKYSPDWIEQLKETKVKDLDLPLVEFTKDDVLTRWAEDGIYNDGDIGYWYPMVFYGEWMMPSGRFVVEDLRPFIHALFILQKMFEKIGWCFVSPFYETNFGRRLICYLLKDDYANSEEQKKKSYVYEKKVFPQGTHLSDIFTFKIQNWSEQIDNNNNFDPVVGEYGKPFDGTFTFKIITGSGSGSFPREGILRAIKNDAFSPLIPDDILFTQSVTLEPNKEYSFDIDAKILAYDIVYFSFHSPVFLNPVLKIQFDVEFHLYANASRGLYVKGDVIDLKKEIDQDMTCYDLFLGFKHLIFGITDEDYTARKVTLYTPHDADVFGQSISGYFNNQFIDLKTNQPPNTTKSVIEPIKDRFVNLGFKKTSDPLLKKSKRLNGTELFSKQIDFGATTNNETEDDLNPIFEGTGTKTETLWGSFGGQRTGFTRVFPYMLDNENKEVSYNISPRIIYAAAYLNQGLSTVFFLFETEYQLLMPISYQEPTGIKIGNQTQEPDEKLVYGDEEGDLWELVYGRFYSQYRTNIKIDALINQTHNEYFDFSQRKWYGIEYDGFPITGRVLRINDFRPCDILSSQLILLPDNIDPECLDVINDANNCDNSAQIQVTSDCECFYFSVQGSYVCNPTLIEWQYKNDDTGGTWTDLSTGNVAQICDVLIPTYVKAKISFDCPECPAIYAIKFIDPCQQNLQCTLTEYINELGETCIQWSFQGNINCGYDTLVVEVNGDDLPSPFLFCGAESEETYTFIATFTPSNGCEDVVLTCTITAGQPVCENFPVLMCIPVAVGDANCFEFIITGQLTSEVETFIVTYECNGQTFTWMQGDDPVCCTGNITAHADVAFCGCDWVCTAEITCVGSGCTAYPTGTALMIAACN